MDEAAALPSPRVLLSRRFTRYYGRLRRPPGLPPTSRLSTGYRARRSGGSSRRPPGRGGPPQFPSPPSERSAPPTPGGSSGLYLQALHPFRGLRPDDPGSAPPLSHPQAGWLTTRQASLDATDRSVASRPKRAGQGFEPATRGLEVRRLVYENAGSAACSSRNGTPVLGTCFPSADSI